LSSWQKIERGPLLGFALARGSQGKIRQNSRSPLKMKDFQALLSKVKGPKSIDFGPCQ
jgi:hypothetical protein